MIHIWLESKPREDITIPQKEPTPVLLSDTTIEKALKEAKDSGMFDGPPGKPGEPGKPGPSYDDSELREEISGKVSDVKINGTALAKTDGVVEIPTASAMNGSQSYGVVTADGWSNYGIQIRSETGEIRTIRASVANIDGRKEVGNPFEFRPIVPSNLDYAVKASLTDGKSLVTWTEAEQAAARERIGAAKSGKYEIIEEITLTEDANNITRTAEPNGTPFNFKSVIIDILASATGGVIHTVVNDNYNTQTYLSGFINGTKRYSRAYHENIGGIIRNFYHASATDAAGVAAVINERNLGFVFADSINKISIANNGNGLIQAGSKITIYAIRA